MSSGIISLIVVLTVVVSCVSGCAFWLCCIRKMRQDRSSKPGSTQPYSTYSINHYNTYAPPQQNPTFTQYAQPVPGVPIAQVPRQGSVPIPPLPHTYSSGQGQPHGHPPKAHSVHSFGPHSHDASLPSYHIPAATPPPAPSLGYSTYPSPEQYHQVQQDRHSGIGQQQGIPPHPWSSPIPGSYSGVPNSAISAIPPLPHAASNSSGNQPPKYLPPAPLQHHGAMRADAIKVCTFRGCS